MAQKDFIGPGFIGSDTIKFIITRGFGSSAKGWAMESLMVFLVAGGARRFSPADAPGASSNKGWAFESLQAMISRGGRRKK